MPDKKISVIQVVQHLRPGGVETMSLDLTARASAGRDVRIVSLEGTEESAVKHWPRLADAAGRLHFMGKKPGIDLPVLARLTGLFLAVRPRAVHTHHIGPLLYGGLAARLAGVRTVIHTEHDAWHLNSRRRRFVQRLALALARPVMTVNAGAVAGAVHAALPGRTLKIIPNGVDLGRFTPGCRLKARSRLGLPSDPLIIGCAARLVPVKRHDDLLDAVSRLPGDVHLALAGDGPERDRLMRQARSLGLGARTHFLGGVDDMPVFYRAIDLFCLASENEGQPIAPLEAQAAGVSCVLTDAGGASDSLCPETGVLVSPHDPAGLARALHGVLARKNTGDPRAFVRRERSLDAAVRSYEALYAPQN